MLKILSIHTRISISAAVLTLFFFATTTSVFAHTTGASWNVTDGAYTVDLGYDPIVFTAEEYARFDFQLWKGAVNTGEPASYAQVWVRIINGNGDTVLATGIWQQPIGPTTLLYEFTNPGSYTFETSYRDRDGNDIAVATFPITVEKAPMKLISYIVPLAALFIGVLLGAGSLILIKWKRAAR